MTEAAEAAEQMMSSAKSRFLFIMLDAHLCVVFLKWKFFSKHAAFSHGR
jgi:hypothetical protein